MQLSVSIHILFPVSGHFWKDIKNILLGHLIHCSEINFFHKFSLSSTSHIFIPSRVLEDASQALGKLHSSPKDLPKGKEGGEGGEGGGYSPCFSYHTLNPSPLRHTVPPRHRRNAQPPCSPEGANWHWMNRGRESERQIHFRPCRKPFVLKGLQDPVSKDPLFKLFLLALDPGAPFPTHS